MYEGITGTPHSDFRNWRGDSATMRRVLNPPTFPVTVYRIGADGERVKVRVEAAD